MKYDVISVITRGYDPFGVIRSVVFLCVMTHAVIYNFLHDIECVMYGGGYDPFGVIQLLEIRPIRCLLQWMLEFNGG